MPFNVGLTGIRAATADLEVTGNNVANASTTGFKKSRAEFGDFYSNGFLNGGNTQIGEGVRVQNIRQDFGQGNLSFTENSLDLAINGQGFFILDNAGERRYSRAGAFGVDRDGYVVNNTNMRLQGFPANEQGRVGDALGSIRVDNSNLAPRRSTAVTTQLNLDSREQVLAQRGMRLISDGNEVGRVAVAPLTGNGYSDQNLDIVLADGTGANLNIPAGSSASAMAAALNAYEGIDASATTQVTLAGVDPAAPAAGFNNASGNMRVTINGVPFDNITSLAGLAASINASTSLAGVRASMDNGNLVIIDGRGNDIQLEVAGNPGDSMVVEGTDSQTLSVGGTTQAVVGGQVDLVMGTGVSVSSPDVDGNYVFGTFAGTPFANNLFDPIDENTYNHSTTTTLYDSLGNAHVLNMYFVKDEVNAAAGQNTWTMYAQVDGQDVGDPMAPGGTPTRAAYNIVFNNDGTVNEILSDPVLISNWIPRDASGQPNGADGPLNLSGGGALPVADPPNSSNFEIRLDNITQFGSPFSVNDMQQDGYTTGRLVGLDVDDDGIIFARYTNAESRVLGQVGLANFNDLAGLGAVGESSWVETYRSGAAIIGKPGTAALGNVRSSALEDSNVDLSEQLVNLITAQRNYQANAKTIETANAVTQTIINLR